MARQAVTTHLLIRSMQARAGRYDNAAGSVICVSVCEAVVGRGVCARPARRAVEAEQREKPDCFVEILDDKTDVDEVGDAGAMEVH
jgi:hypothetical protein